jgi:hypothetical protein
MMKKFIAVVFVLIAATLTLYFGMRFIDAVFTSVEKDLSAAVAVTQEL